MADASRPRGGSADDRSPLRVAVANDFEIVIAGLAAMLDRHPGIVVVDMFIVGEETPHEPIDIVLYDAFGREGIDGPQLSTLVSTQNVHHVAVFTLSWADSLTQSALGYGVSGVLSKSLRSEDLAARLHEIADGTIVIAPPPNGRVSSGLVAIGRDDHLACPNARPKHWSCSLRVCVTARSPARCT